jgi:hypothetical protein
VFEADPVVVIAVALWMMGGMTLLGKVVHSMYVRHKAGIVVEPYEGPLIGGVVALSVAPLVYVLSGNLFAWGGAIPAVAGVLLIGLWLSGRRRARTQRTEGSRAMSFREKSAAVVLLTNLVVFGWYFAKTWDASLAAAVPVFFKAVALSISVLIGAHILIAVHSRAEDVDAKEDERDKMVDLFSTRNAHYVLLVGAWLVPVLAIQAAAPLVIANTALAVLVATALVSHGSQIVYYRFGI